MSRKNRININIGKFYIEMENLYKEAAEHYSFEEGDENVFFRISVPVLQAVKQLMSKNPDKEVIYFKIYDDEIIYINYKEHDDNIYRLHQVKEADIKSNLLDSANAIDLLSKEGIEAMTETCFDYGGFVVRRDDYFADMLKFIAIAIYNAVVKLFQEQFSSYKSIRGDIVGFRFIMDCTGKRKFNSNDIEFYIQL